MAIEVSPDYGGVISQGLVVAAQQGLQTMKLLGQRIGKTALPSTLPIGSGNEDQQWGISGAFYPETEQDILAETTGAIGLENFVAKTSVDAGSYVDYFVNGTNYKISYDNFVSGLGVTGSIVSEGPGVATPILDIDGSVNKIRVIENGSGVKAELSPSNGVELSHNFTADVVGTPLFLNVLADQPVIASLVAGAGISITSTDNYLTINSEEASEYATITMQGNSTATVISSTATAVKAAGTFVVGVRHG